MRRTFLLLVLFALVPTLAAASGPAFTHRGAFMVGGLEAFYGPDACAMGGATDGFDSNCIDLPAGLAGHTFSLQDISDDTGVLATDPNRNVPAAVFDPARDACFRSPSPMCPVSPQILYYPLMGVCFYPPGDTQPIDFTSVLGCGFTGVVPEGAGKAAVTASGGLNVAYTFVVD